LVVVVLVHMILVVTVVHMLLMAETHQYSLSLLLAVVVVDQQVALAQPQADLVAELLEKMLADLEVVVLLVKDILEEIHLLTMVAVAVVLVALVVVPELLDLEQQVQLLARQ
jgi:hypothetical protein